MKIALGMLIMLTSQITFAMSEINGCRDNRGLSVQVQVTNQITQAAESQIADGNPFILANPKLMEQYSPEVQNFILAHECSHHQKGHVSSLFYEHTVPVTLEFEADCEAIHTLKQLKMLNEDGLGQIQKFLTTLVEDQTHPAGTYRAQYAAMCANQ